jgi:chemotaxis signal transduction protein
MADPEKKGADKRFDWSAARARMERFNAADDGAGPSVRQTLRERAAALAAPRGSEAPVETLDLVVFRVGALALAAELGQVGEVFELSSHRSLPTAPKFYLGIMVHRGTVVPVIDLRPLLDLPQGDEPLPLALLVTAASHLVAVAVSGIDGVTRIDASAVAANAENRFVHNAVTGVLPDGVTVIDVHRLVLDARLVVNDEPQASGVN